MKVKPTIQISDIPRGYPEKIYYFLQYTENQSAYNISHVDLSRTSILDFPTVALSIIKLIKESVEFVIDGVFSQLFKTQVTGSAFCQT